MKLALPVAVVLLGCGAPARVEHRAAAGDLAIAHVTVVPMDRDGALPDHTVLIRNGVIVAVAPASQVDVRGAAVIDGTGRWLVPGLADMHVHLWADRDLDLFLLQGVTTVRDLFGSLASVDRRDRIARGDLRGPTVIAAGPILDGDPPFWPGSDVVTSAESARTAVRAQFAVGYDFLKVYNGVSAEAYAAILDEADALGMPVAGHVPRAVSIADAIVSGQRTIEHLDGYVPFDGEPVVDDAIVAATAASGVWNCPTLIVTDRFGHLDDPAQLRDTRGLEHVTPMVLAAWDPANDFRLADWGPERFEAARVKQQVRRALVRDLHAAGARLVLGTDTGNPYVIPGFAVHDELALLVDAGVPVADALRMATAAAAEMVGTPGAFGVVAPGARADLLLVDANPLDDLAALRDPYAVIVRGEPLIRDALLARLEDASGSVDALGELPVEGTPLVHARYQLLLGDAELGVEQAIRSRLDDGTIVVRGEQITPDSALTYRSTPTTLDLEDDRGVVEVRAGGGIATGRRGDDAPVELAAASDAVVAPQTIAEFFWYADRLAELAIGEAQVIHAIEVMAENGLRLDPASFTFTRAADDGARKVYDLAGTHGELSLTGRLVVDADGAPREVALHLHWGTFTMRRMD